MTNASRPKMVVIVDTEEEFDWSAPFSRRSTSTLAVHAQGLAHEIFEQFDIVPTYVVDYPVAANEESSSYLSGLATAGRAHLGAHLHPWVTPPHDEIVSRYNSYHCNLPSELERAKILELTDLITRRFGAKPTIFKSGRYGLGQNTTKCLIEAGYKIDCSVVPYTNFQHVDGPNFLNFPDQPYWLDYEARLLEVPLTVGFLGWGATFGPMLRGIFDQPLAHKLKLPGVMARTGILERSRLSPEGVSEAEQCELLKALKNRGKTIFSLTYHSPSLVPGNTPYVRTSEELKGFLHRLKYVFRYFREELGGEFSSLPELYRMYLETPSAN